VDPGGTARRRSSLSVRVPGFVSKGNHVRREENNAPPSLMSQGPVLARGDEVSVAYRHELSNAAVAWVWAATLLASWALVGFVVAAIWWLAT
jgi:hypothetical protein